MPPVNRDLPESDHAINRGPRGPLAHRLCDHIVRHTADNFEHEDDPALVLDQRGTSQAGNFTGGGLDSERKQIALTTLDPSFAATKEPEPAGFIDPARVTRAVPDLPLHAELGLRVAPSIQVPFQDVVARDHDFARRVNRLAHSLELQTRTRLDRRGPLLVHDA